MKILWTPHTVGRQPSPRIFLSASVPSLRREELYLHGPVSKRLMARIIELRVRAAVTNLVVELFRIGGQLIFGGHPAIVPMVAAAAESFSRNERDDFPILLYQSRSFEKETTPLGRSEMEASHIAKVWWVPADPQEAADQFELDTPYLLDPDVFSSLCEWQQHARNSPVDVVKALVALRVVMFLHKRPQAILSMGGMEGITAEARMYQLLQPHLRPDQIRGFRPDGTLQNFPLRTGYSLRSTWGAGRNLNDGTTNFLDYDLLSEPADNFENAQSQLTELDQYQDVMREFVQKIARASNER